MDEKLITDVTVDDVMSSLVGATSSATRAAIVGLLPKTSGASVTSVVQSVRQAADGSWGNPVRGGDVAARFWIATTENATMPTYAGGLRVGDLVLGPGTARVATIVPTTGAATWAALAPVGVSTGGGSTTPTTPTPGVGTGSGDTSTPSPTARPYAALAMTGTWATTGGTTLPAALSDKSSTAATGTPTSGTTGVALTLDLTNFSHSNGNNLTVGLWGVKSSQAGTVRVSLGRGSTVYAPELTAQIGTTAQDVTLTWKDGQALALPMETWADVELTVKRDLGDLTIGDITLQSLPPTQPTTPGGDPTSTSGVLWASTSAWYTDITTAPLGKVTGKGAYVAGLGPLRLDALPGGESPQVVVVTGSTPRSNVTPPAASTRGDLTLMHNASNTGALDGVPIPADMVAPTNTFRTCIIACPDTRQVWELLGLIKTTTGWAADWGARFDDVPNNPGAKSDGTGYTGSGLSAMASLIKLSEARDAAAGNAKAIGHALALNLPYGAAASSSVWPATRSDGAAADANAPKMGERLRLPASFDTTTLTGVARAVAEAAKKYGLIIHGGGSKLSIVVESGAAEQARTGIDPWGTILGGKSVDDVLAGIPLTKLEAVSPGWGGPGWAAETDAPVVTPTPTNPTVPVAGLRRTAFMPAGVQWLSGASCRWIENSSEGMGSQFAQWRGEACWMGRCWADGGGEGSTERNDPNIASLTSTWKNWHSSIDVGIGFLGQGDTYAAAASGAYDARWTQTLQVYRGWWASRRNPSQVNAFISPAHELNGSWYYWSVNSSNYTQFIAAWKRFRALQLKIFPESFLCLNLNRESSFYDSSKAQSAGKGMDWRKMVPGYAEGNVKQWVDYGGVDYYNQNPNAKNQAEFDSHALAYDGYGAPKGIERHRQFWEAQGLPLIVPEWSNNAGQGDSPAYATAMNSCFRQHAGVGPGQITAEAVFNLSAGYDEGKFAVVGDTVGSPQFAQRYRDLKWGVPA